MKIVIFAGGTGSVALQRGLYESFGREVEYSVITNLFDNGKSTGVCRTVMGGEILGPSDLRKNQELRHRLMHGSTPLLTLLEKRVTMDRDSVENFITEELAKVVSVADFNTLVDGVYTFFEEADSHQIEYVDFSIANIIYAGLARHHGNSMVAAGKIMAKILRIPEDAVICSSDESLYLTAQTASGHTILDEGDLVEWNNPDDKIIGIKTITNTGEHKQARLSIEADTAIRNADLIIYSSGTQWSSLIPTYEHVGFLDATLATKAKQYLVMNITQDKDLKGVSGDELISILSSYIDFNKTVIVQTASSEHFIKNEDGFLTILNDDVLDGFSRLVRHDGEKLVRGIFRHYYADVISSDMICFDFDDTLVARNGALPTISAENLSLFTKPNFTICTGNSARAVINKAPSLSDAVIFSERGANKTINDKVIETASPLKSEFHFLELDVNLIISKLQQFGIPLSKIHNRHNTIIAIKPIADEYKTLVIKTLQMLFPELMVIPAGKTTVEISKACLDKNIIVDSWFKGQKLTYVGDEYESGNDALISKNPNINFVKVNSVKDTNMLLRVLSWKNDI